MDKVRRILTRLNKLNTLGFWVGLLTGLFYFGYVFWWYWSLYPLSSLGVENRKAAGTIIFLVYSSSVLITGFFWGLFGLFSQKFIRESESKFLPLILGATFMLAEYCRAIFFSIFWYGSGGAVGPYWPVGNPAYWLANIKIISLSSSRWGIYGIDFVIIFIFSAIFFGFFKKKYILLLQALLTIAILLIFSLTTYSKTNQNPVVVSIIQTHTPSFGLIDPEENLNDLNDKLNTVKQAVEADSDIIVFPEGANFLTSLNQLLNSNDVKKYFTKLSNKNILIFDSVRSAIDSKFRSRAVIIDTKNGLVGGYDKKILTPGGEFIPYLIKIPLMVFSPYLREQFRMYNEFEPGEGDNVIEYNGSKYKIIICSEMISPNKTQGGNPDFNFIMGSFAMWEGNKLATDQALAMLRFRAMESGKYTVLASNYGRSYIIDSLGNITKKPSSTESELLTGTIIPNKKRTWYNYVGDWPILLLSSVIFWLSFRKIRNDKSS